MLSACGPFVFLEDAFHFLEDRGPSIMIPGMNPGDSPTIRQLTADPMFIGNGKESIPCMHCGHILAASIHVRSIVALDLQCFNCQKITPTRQWPDGEAFPRNPLSLGASGNFGVSQVTLNDRNIITSDAEIIRVRSSTKAQAPMSLSSEPLSSELVNCWEDELNILTGNEFSKMTAAARRARASGNLRFLQCPPAWAIAQLQSQEKESSLQAADDNAFALCLIALTFHLVRRWRHHHHFDIIANSICSEFNHTATMLTAASYLTDSGNDIGITDVSSSLGRSPDLYVNTGPMSRLSIEVKAPKLFFWPSPLLSFADMEKHIYKTLKGARSQLTGLDGGVVILGASRPEPRIKEMFETAINNVMNSGKVSSRIAAVAAVYQSYDYNINDGVMNFKNGANIWCTLNPKFQGENPVIMKSR